MWPALHKCFVIKYVADYCFDGFPLLRNAEPNKLLEFLRIFAVMTYDLQLSKLSLMFLVNKSQMS